MRVLGTGQISMAPAVLGAPRIGETFDYRREVGRSKYDVMRPPWKPVFLQGPVVGHEVGPPYSFGT